MKVSAELVAVEENKCETDVTSEGFWFRNNPSCEIRAHLNVKSQTNIFSVSVICVHYQRVDLGLLIDDDTDQSVD